MMRSGRRARVGSMPRSLSSGMRAPITARSVAMTRTTDLGWLVAVALAPVAVEKKVMSGGQSARPPISLTIDCSVPEPMGPRKSTRPPVRFTDAMKGCMKSTSCATARLSSKLFSSSHRSRTRRPEPSCRNHSKGTRRWRSRPADGVMKPSPSGCSGTKRGGQRGDHRVAGAAPLLRVLGIVAAEDHGPHDVGGGAGTVELDDDLAEALAPRALRLGILVGPGVLRPLQVLVDGREGILPEPARHVLERAGRIARDLGRRRPRPHELPLPDENPGQRHEHGGEEGDGKPGAVLLIGSGHALVPCG